MKLDMDPIDLGTKPEVDRLRCWRQRPVAAGTAPNSDYACKRRAPHRGTSIGPFFLWVV